MISSVLICRVIFVFSNALPPTTTLPNLMKKINVAEPKIYVNCAFWGGVIPGNDSNLVEMVRHGVVGFKCFLCPSGTNDDFPNVTLDEVEVAMERLKGLETVLAVSGRLCVCEELGKLIFFYFFYSSTLRCAV